MYIPLFTGTGACDIKDFAIPQGKVVTFTLENATTDVFEFKAQPAPGTSGFSITDAQDAIDATKKIINAANNLRSLYGPQVVNIVRIAGTSDVTLHLTVSA